MNDKLVRGKKRLKKILHEDAFSPVQKIVFSFFCVISVGTLLLMLPISATKDPLDFLTSLFTATSATCVTGLTLIDPYLDLTIFGQVVLAMLIELGGLGFLSFVSFFMFSINKKAGLHSLQLAQDAMSSVDFKGTKQLFRTVFFTSATIQSLGAILLAIRFVPMKGLYGLWVSVFTSVSAYCNAGFDLMGFEGRGSSMVNYNGDPLVLYTIMFLIIFGGLGFIVFQDFMNFHKSHHLLLHTRTVIAVTIALILIGTGSFLLLEFNNPETIGNLPFSQKFTASMFQSVVSRTAGFCSINLGNMYDTSKFIYMMLMFIGAGSGSTGGGIKVTTFSVLVATIISVIKGRDDVTVFERRVDKETVYKSIAITFLAMLVVIMCAGVILICNPDLSGIDGFFEAVSAFGTVGSSTGVTGIIGTPEKIAIILTMFIGRVGPISFVLAVTMKSHMKKNIILPEGKIMVG